MKIAILAPSPVPFVLGGAENLWSSWLNYLNTQTVHQADLIKLPSPERDFWEIIDSYHAFSRVNLDHFDAVITTKYPAWMIRHPRKILYLQHKLRGLYDTYPTYLSRALPVHPALNDLQKLIAQPHPERKHLSHLWDILTDLRQRQHQLPAETFALPGPLIRAIVHFMDQIALSPTEVTTYATLSHTVAKRPDYFPAGVHVHVLPHPSGLTVHPPQTGRAIFTTSRHDAPKRLDMLIRAYRQTRVSYPLRIGGEGPQTDELKALAQGDSRIEFLGRLTAQQLAQEYAQALFVPFIPDQEDLGLITLEAYNSHKAVLTTDDSGGAAELVQHQKTGLVVPAQQDVLAQAITQLCQTPHNTRQMGAAGAEQAKHISWQTLTRTLLDSLSPRALLVLNTYSIYPPMGGGQQRIYQLYKALGHEWSVTHLALVPALGDVGELSLASGFQEHRIPRSLYHHTMERMLSDQLKASVGDLSAILYAHANPHYVQAISHHIAHAQPLVVLSHPYLYPMLRRAYQGPYIYEAHNVEADLKQDILGHSPQHLQQIIDTERDCARHAAHVIACSHTDAQRLIERYQLDPQRVSVIPNGADTQHSQPATHLQKQAARDRLNLAPDTLVALYMASYHGPNNQGLDHLLAIAPHCPHIQFVVLGSVAQHVRLIGAAIPDNLRLTGPVADTVKQDYLAASDIALNPMTSGSGTNLKMLDYAAAGLLILSTPFGGRGGLLQPNQHFIAADIQDFAHQLNRLQHQGLETCQTMIRQARTQVEQHADWQVLARQYKRLLCDLYHA